MGFDFLGLSFINDAWPGLLLRRYGEKKECIKCADAMFYYYVCFKHSMGSFWLQPLFCAK
jgi:hypothetical protein